MRTFDLTPFYRSTVGFDRLFNMLDQAGVDGAPRGIPPASLGGHPPVSFEGNMARGSPGRDRR